MSIDYRHRDTHRHRTRGALGRALSVSVLAAAATCVVGCGENEPPMAVGAIPGLTIDVRRTDSVDVARYFSDPDADVLTYTATTSDTGVATASVSGSAVMVSGVSQGVDTVEVTATDPDGLSAMQVFAVTVRLTERRVLEILYDDLDGDSWTDNTNWKTDKPLDEWYGVSTKADGRVVTLDLSGNSLVGEIPWVLGGLASLEYLYLGDNQLSGEIPPELGDLSNLAALSPSELGNLSNLEILWLSLNSLTGELPLDLLDLSLLQFYWFDNDGLCAPNTIEFDDWLDELDWLGPRCD